MSEPFLYRFGPMLLIPESLQGKSVAYGHILTSGNVEHFIEHHPHVKLHDYLIQHLEYALGYITRYLQTPRTAYCIRVRSGDKDEHCLMYIDRRFLSMVTEIRPSKEEERIDLENLLGITTNPQWYPVVEGATSI